MGEGLAAVLLKLEVTLVLGHCLLALSLAFNLGLTACVMYFLNMGYELKMLAQLSSAR